jgi:hypothetical protein
MRVATLSQRFFSKGEEQEANGYKGVILDDDAPPSPELEFDSFDRIPRRRRPLLAITALLVSLPVIGFVTWRSTGGFGRSGASVNDSARAMVAGQPAPTNMPTPPPPAGAPARIPAGSNPESSLPAIAPGTCQPTATERAEAAVPPRPAVEESDRPARPIVAAAPEIKEQPAKAAPKADVELETRTQAANKAAARPIAETRETKAAPRSESESSTAARKSRSSGALRGYVWSPEANGLVPAGSPVAPQPGAAPITELGAAPTTEPSGARTTGSSAGSAQEPRVAPPPRIAPPVAPGASPAQEEQPSVAPRPRIAAPETGPMPAEKAPIIE